MIRMVFALALALGTCELATGPGAAVRLTLDVQRLAAGQAVPTEVTAQGGEGEIVVGGRLGTPTPCQRLSARAGKSGDEVTLRVVVRPEGGVCVAAVGGFAYRAVLRDLPAGTYRLRVTHRYPETGDPEERTVLDRTVRVE